MHELPSSALPTSVDSLSNNNKSIDIPTSQYNIEYFIRSIFINRQPFSNCFSFRDAFVTTNLGFLYQNILEISFQIVWLESGIFHCHPFYIIAAFVSRIFFMAFLGTSVSLLSRSCLWDVMDWKPGVKKAWVKCVRFRETATTTLFFTDGNVLVATRHL